MDWMDWLRCRLIGHYMVIQEVNIESHDMILICTRCHMQTRKTTALRIRMPAGQAYSKQAENH